MTGTALIKVARSRARSHRSRGERQLYKMAGSVTRPAPSRKAAGQGVTLQLGWAGRASATSANTCELGQYRGRSSPGRGSCRAPAPPQAGAWPVQGRAQRLQWGEGDQGQEHLEMSWRCEQRPHRAGPSAPGKDCGVRKPRGNLEQGSIASDGGLKGPLCCWVEKRRMKAAVEPADC